MSRSPPRYSLDEGERLATGTAENHPLLSTEHESGKVDARDDKSQPLEQISRGFGILDTEMGMRYGYGFGVGSGAGPSSGAAGGSGDASTAEGAGAAAPAPRALYGKFTTLYSLHPTYMVPGGTETCIGILGRDRQDTLRIIRQAFPILDNYPSERIMLKVSRSAMGVGERVENPTTGQMTIAPTEDFDHLERYPPDCEKTRNRLHELVEVMDDAWGFLQEMPPGRVRVLVRPTEEDKKRAWRQYWRGLHIFLGLTGGPMLIAIIWVMIAAALGRL